MIQEEHHLSRNTHYGTRNTHHSSRHALFMSEKKADDFTGTFTTRSPEETFALARRIGEGITAPTVFLLIGDLGAGKTVFAKGLAAGPDEPTRD
jgi:DNA replication protein DnaC